MDAENWDKSDNFSEDLDYLEKDLDVYDIIKDEICTARTTEELKSIKLNIGIVAFNSLKRFASKELLEQM